VPAALRKMFTRLPETWMVPQSVQAERCRFIESTQCASVCVNSCKVPSQEWLFKDFGMNVHIRPNYDDFSCNWKFGERPFVELRRPTSPSISVASPSAEGAACPDPERRPRTCPLYTLVW